MPIYEYACSDGHGVEHVFKMDAVPEHVVCECGKHAHRVFRAPAAIHFKGSGFYTTDVKSRLHRKRRRNPGDDLHTPFDTQAAAIADAI